MTDSRDVTCFFTGHRDIPKSRVSELKDQVARLIGALYRRGWRVFVCGGAVGFDQLCAETVLAAKEKMEDIKLHLVLPCANQCERFSDSQKEAYMRVKAAADSVDILHDSYTRACMLERNRKMVDMSSLGIAFCNRDFGGTAYTVNYARKQSVDIIVLK